MGYRPEGHGRVFCIPSPKSFTCHYFLLPLKQQYITNTTDILSHYLSGKETYLVSDPDVSCNRTKFMIPL